MYIFTASKEIRKHEMEFGTVDMGLDKMVIFGVAGSGKTCSLRALLGLDPPPEESTGLMERPISVMVISEDDGKQWKPMSPEEVYKRIAEIIQTQAAELSVDSPNKGISSQQQQSSSPEQQPAPSTPLEPKSMVDEFEYLDTSIKEAISDMEDTFLSLAGTSATSSKPILQQNWLYVIDSGGQPEFHEVLPIFLRGASDFIFVFKLNETLDFHPENTFRLPKPNKPIHIGRSHLTNGEMYKQCMCTMSSFTSRNEDKSKDKKKKSSPPQILILGTHHDKVSQKLMLENLTSVNKLVKDTLLPHFRMQMIQKSEENYVFPIIANQPENENTKKCLRECKELLDNKHGKRREDVPLRWHTLEYVLRRVADKLGRKVLSLKECKWIAYRSLKIEGDSCKEALIFFSDLNLLCYWPDILPNVVFIEPQVVIDKVSELCIKSYQVRSQPTGGEWCDFREYGQVTEGLLETFEGHYVHEPPLFTPKDLVTLFKDLLVFAELSSNEWFMPSLLKVEKKESLKKYRYPKTALAIHFPGKRPPVGMFCCMIAFFLHSNEQQPKQLEVFKSLQGKPECLARNVFKLLGHVDDIPVPLTVIDYFTHFEVHVPNDADVTQIWELIIRSVFESVEGASKILGCTDNTPKAAIVCSASECSELDPHHAIVNKKGIWSCSKNEVRGNVKLQEIPWWKYYIAGTG